MHSSCGLLPFFQLANPLLPIFSPDPRGFAFQISLFLAYLLSFAGFLLPPPQSTKKTKTILPRVFCPFPFSQPPPVGVLTVPVGPVWIIEFSEGRASPFSGFRAYADLTSFPFPFILSLTSFSLRFQSSDPPFPPPLSFGCFFLPSLFALISPTFYLVCAFPPQGPCQFFLFAVTKTNAFFSSIPFF